MPVNNKKGVNQWAIEIAISSFTATLTEKLSSYNMGNLCVESSINTISVVVAKYYESIAIDVKKPGQATPGMTAEQVAGRAKPGEMPAGVMANQITITATVTAIDAKKPSVTLKGPEGNVKEVKIKDPKKLENVKVGDLVVITYTEALAISVQKPQKK